MNPGLGKKTLSGFESFTSRPATSIVVCLDFATVVDIFAITTPNQGPTHRR